MVLASFLIKILSEIRASFTLTMTSQNYFTVSNKAKTDFFFHYAAHVPQIRWLGIYGRSPYEIYGLQLGAPNWIKGKNGGFWYKEVEVFSIGYTVRISISNFVFEVKKSKIDDEDIENDDFKLQT